MEDNKILKSKKRSRYTDDIVNDFTRELDKYTKGRIESVFCNYIYPEKIKRAENKHSIAFRYPGATRGYIQVDNNNIITKIVIYEESKDLYRDGVHEAIEKFIGYKLEF